MRQKSIPLPVLGLAVLLMVATGKTYAVLIDFENQAVGGIVNTIQADGIDVTFNSNVAAFGLDLVTSSSANTGNATTSGSNYLGVNDGFSELFIAGDNIQLSFSAAITEFAVSFIATSNTPANVFEIKNDFESVFNDIPTAFLGSDEVFSFGILSNTAFSTVSLIAASGTLVSFNIDDIRFSPADSTPPDAPVPAPPTLWLLVCGLFGLLTRFKKTYQSVPHINPLFNPNYQATPYRMHQ